jgi:uncharacterized protein
MSEREPATRDQSIEIDVDGDTIAGTLVQPAKGLAGVLLVHGWGGSQKQYLRRAREIAALGCVCLTIDLRGHARDEARSAVVTRADNLRDVLAGYDALIAHPSVDPSAIAVVGSSYGGYLAALLTALRPVKWLALRSPALYKDEDWAVAKRDLDREALTDYRRQPVAPSDNRALTACGAFAGDVLVVESEHDQIVPHQVIVNFRTAFASARSMTYRMIDGADHGLSDETMQQAYTTVLVNWSTEMLAGARKGPPPGDDGLPDDRAQSASGTARSRA